MTYFIKSETRLSFLQLFTKLQQISLCLAADSIAYFIKASARFGVVANFSAVQMIDFSY